MMHTLTLVAALAASQSAPRRHAIPAGNIRHEIGHCYIASMDFGEDGDKETKNKSQLVVYEDGKPLGPAKSLHKAIREQGMGRYSHWTRTGLYFSASDNTDPRENGRRYEVGSANPENMLGGLERFIGEPRRHREVVRSSQHVYEIELGGNVDFENSHTRHNGTFVIAFQPNVSVTIENTGDISVDWPQLIANGRADWGTFDRLLADFTRGATNDQEKALFIWQTAREHRYHETPLFANNEFHDPVKMFNSYGLNLCDDMGYGGCSMFRAVGLGKPKYEGDSMVRALHGHVQCEAMVNGKLQFLDIDESVFHLDRENEAPVSGDECARDHDLVRRDVHYGPVFGGWGGSESNAALFGADDTLSTCLHRGHTMRYMLCPREKVILRWDNIGKWAAQSDKWSHQPKYFGNSKFVYTPRLEGDHYREGIAEEQAIVPPTVPGARLAGGAGDARLVYDIRTPWVMCGGAIEATFAGLGEGDAFAIDVEPKGAPKKRVWEAKGAGEKRVKIAIEDALVPHKEPAKYQYRVTITLSSADKTHGANLKSLRFETDVMAAPVSLPRLKRGNNTFRYADETAEPHEITITHEWLECHEVTPPFPPGKLAYPPDGQTIRDSIVPFKWPAVPRCKSYHLQVSRRPDFRIPYKPTYDVIIRDTSWSVPYTGMFAPDTTYYCRLRASSGRGIWTEWSQPTTFRWAGPRVTRNVRLEPRGDGMWLAWDANPKGTRPVAYDVYGSDEKGFSVHKKEYVSYTRGKVPANFLGRTERTEMRVLSSSPDHPNMNRCYYRVVAVDEHGTEGICSDFVELPHPHVWSSPVVDASVGKAYRYEARSITSLGDVQHRYEKPGNQLWDIEKVTFELAEAPRWLTVDPASGVLTGTPAAPGKAKVALKVTNQHGKKYVQTYTITAR